MRPARAPSASRRTGTYLITLHETWRWTGDDGIVLELEHERIAFHAASLYCRQRGLHEEGYQIAREGLPLTEASLPSGLGIQSWMYAYGLLDEYAVNAYLAGHPKACLDACLRILSHPACPEDQRGRFLDNAKAAASHL